MSPAEPRKWPWRSAQTNTASDNAFVGVQGTVIGDVRYEVSADDPPARKYEVAKNCLAGKMAPRAKQLIEEAVEKGFVSAGSTDALVNEVAYHWTIAVLSDQSFELLKADQFADLERACWLCRNGPDDDWRRAHHTITRLIACLQDQEENGRLDPDAFDAFSAAFDRLPDERRAEIRRHLDPIVNGVIQDRLDASLADVVRTQRTADDRDKRVWKFFEPVPVPPRPKVLITPALGPFEEAMTLCGAVLSAAGVVLAFRLVVFESVKAALIIGAVVLAGGLLVTLFAPGQFPARYSALHPRRPRPTPTNFSAYVQESVQRQFGRQAPTTLSGRSAWWLATRRIRSLLGDDIVDLYSEPEISHDAIDWLIAWYAEDAARRWSTLELDDPDRPLKILALATGATAMAGGWIAALSEMVKAQGTITLVAMAWLGCGIAFLAWSRTDVRVVMRRRYAAEKEEADRRFAAESQAYEARRALLENRPDDDEMARWLDYDKIYLKTLAIKQYGLANRDVIAHAILTEAAEPARRARVTGGQPRFSAYVVWIFLLTKSGTRQVAVNLDFPTGIASDQQRTAFRYDAIASAQVREIGVRFDSGRREIILPRTDGGKRPHNSTALIFYQDFLLSLTNGQKIGVKVENFDATLLEQPPEQDESLPAPDLSDLTGALSLLEAVAADGRKWIEQARIRHGHKPLHDEPDHPATDGVPAGPLALDHRVIDANGASDSTAN